MCSVGQGWPTKGENHDVAVQGMWLFTTNGNLTNLMSWDCIKDERLHSLQQISKYSSHAVVLTKMLQEQLLKPEELQLFESFLMPHQRAVSYQNRNSL